MRMEVVRTFVHVPQADTLEESARTAALQPEHTVHNLDANAAASAGA